MNEQEELKFICFIDKNRCQSDYLDGNNYIRLIGLDPSQITNETKKTSFFTLDINIDEFTELKSKNNFTYVDRYLKAFQDGRMIALITYKITTSSKSYFYKTISNDEPKYIELIKASFQSPLHPIFKNSKNVIEFFKKQSEEKTKTNSITTADEFKFKCFSMGQGMCSIIHTDNVGYLFDLGAGTPIKRDGYLNNSYINKLKEITNELTELNLILSHLDSDHYRVFCWDKSIREKIKTIYLPENTSWHLEKDIDFHATVYHVSSFSINSKNMNLSIFRTSPINSQEKNDNALICHLEINNKFNLLPGDYVYKKFKTDQNQSIVNLLQNKYDYLVVPHHGDEASQHEIPCPATNNSSVAYFSAGDHKGYGHPTDAAIDAHNNIGYITLKNSSIAEIIIMHQS